MIDGIDTATRCVAVELAVSGACLALGRALVLDLTASPSGLGGPGAGATSAVVALCELALVGCLLWAWAGTTAVVVDAARGRTRVGGTRGVPHAWRRVILLACGIALTAGAALPAQATPGGVHLDPTGRRADALLAGLPMPERAVGHVRLEVTTPTPHRTVTRPPATASHDERDVAGSVVVVDGDSLWQIAARTLPAHASQDDVADRWRAIYRTNRALLGPDPDRITPGQELTLPPA